MKWFITVCALFLLGGLTINALEAPPAKGYVSDYAGLLSASESQTIDAKLRAHEQQTSNQVVVLTVKSLEGEPIERFGIKVFDSWKVGQKGKDNGVIFIISKDDRKTRIEVGYGLEGALTDLECELILENVVKPRFREGNYYQGINEAIDAIFKGIAGEFLFTPAHRESDKAEGDFTSQSRQKTSDDRLNLPALMIVCFIILIPFIIVWFTHPHIRSSGGWSSGRGGGIGGGWSGGGGGGFGGGGGGFSGGGGRGGGGGASGGW